MKIGKKITDKDQLLKFFRFIDNFEGEIVFRYGKIGQGKTYGATADVLDDLQRGWTVYVTWPMDFQGFDQRDSLLFVIGSLFFPWKNDFKKIPKQNLKFLDVTSETFVEELGSLKNCKVYIDEAHLGFDSYEALKTSIKKRANVLHTRHFNRTLNIISQRPTAVSAYLRGNVSRYYKFEKYGRYPLILFKRTEYQEMIDEVPDENKPESIKLYLFSKQIASMYNSKFMAEDLKTRMTFQVYKVNYFIRIFLLFRILFRPLINKLKR
jgi:hypothetical protein